MIEFTKYNWSKIIMHVDMNAFFASIEQRDFIYLRNKPVAITNGLKGSCIITCSYEARAFGIKTGMRFIDAKKLCPKLIRRSSRPNHYAKISAEIMKVLKNISPDIEIFSVDEAFLDLTRYQKIYFSPFHVAYLIKHIIYNQFGLTCSIGISDNKSTAKFASKLKKPNGITLIKPQDAEKILSNYPVTELCGVAKGVKEFLKYHGVLKCKDMTDKPIGVNLTFLPTVSSPDYPSYIQSIIDGGVPIVETAGRNPQAHLPALKDAGITVIHKCTSVRHALKAESIGCDAVSVDGFECAGHPGEDDIPNFILLPLAAEKLSLPFVASGGMADGRSLVSALSLGADGVNMGTRFMVTKEAPIHENVKNAIIEASELDTRLVMRPLRNTERVLVNPTVQKVLEIRIDDDQDSIWMNVNIGDVSMGINMNVNDGFDVQEETTTSTMAEVIEITQQLENFEGVGRILIDLPAAIGGEGSADYVVEDGDVLSIPRRSSTVTVVGEVMESATHVYQQGLLVNDYIGLSAGTSERADEEGIYIVRADGSNLRYSSRDRRRWWRFDVGTSLVLEPGDTIVIPVDSRHKESLTQWREVTQILYQGLVSVAAVARL